MKKLIYALLWIGLLSSPLQADGSGHQPTIQPAVAHDIVFNPTTGGAQ